MSKVKWNSKEIQSHLKERIQIATVVNKIISEKFTHNTDCAKTWDELFEESFVATKKFFSQRKEATRLGGGSYGIVYRVHLIKANHIVMAMKLSKNMNLMEAKRTVMTSALAEVGINPHFQILYAHFHCASVQPIITQGTYLTWREAEPQVKMLVEHYQKVEENLPKLSDTNRALAEADLNRTGQSIKMLFRKIFPTEEEEKFWLTQKRALERARINSSNLEESPTQLDASIYKDVTLTYRKIVDIRSKHTKPFELMALEYGDGTIESLAKKKLSDVQVVSMVFQTCVAILSMQAYGDLVHNDIAPRNIMYNYVNATTTYCYKVGTLNFRVPLGGYLCKVIDFGLTTNTKSYLKYSKHRWCPGGSLRGGNPDGRSIDCVPHLRDFIEFLYEFKRIMQTLSPKVTKWLGVLLYTVKRLKVGSWDPGTSEEQYDHALGRQVAIKFVQEAFTKLLKASKFKFSFQTPCEGSEPVFHVTDASRKREVREKGLEKLWYENINTET